MMRASTLSNDDVIFTPTLSTLFWRGNIFLMFLLNIRTGCIHLVIDGPVRFGHSPVAASICQSMFNDQARQVARQATAKTTHWHCCNLHW